MVNQIVQRRMAVIASHLGGCEEVKGNHLFRTNCSSTVESVIQRRDNRLLFARQGSISQAPFMRQATKQEPPQENFPLRPLFARPIRSSGGIQEFVEYQSIADDSSNVDSVMSEPPRFARPGVNLEKTERCLEEEIQQCFKQTTKICGKKWSPQMDVVEHASKYILMIELPGVSSKTIRVEMDDKNLIVSGTRTNHWQSNVGAGPAVTYHRKEISQGAYRIAWPLPIDVNKDGVSAELVLSIIAYLVIIQFDIITSNKILRIDL